MLLHKEPHAKDVLPPIQHILWMHGQGLTNMGHHGYSRVLSIQASEHPSCGTSFGEKYKITKPLLGLSMLLSENHRPWMGYQIFHMFYEYMGKV